MRFVIMAKFLSPLFLLVLVQLSTCQEAPNCSALEVPYSGLPFSGASLRVCTRNGLQCCTEEYIEEVLNRTGELLPDGVRAELNRTIEIYARIIRRLQNFLEGNFLRRFYNRLGYSNLDFLSNLDRSDFLRNFTAGLRDNFVIDEEDNEDEDSTRGRSRFNVGNFLRRFVDRIEDTAPGLLVRTNTIRDCIRRVINSSINMTNMQDVSEDIEQLRRSLSSGLRLLNFMENFGEDLGGFRPLRQCVTTLVRLNYCSRCVRRTPPLCRNVCGALTRGCYSPFVTGLRAQFENLWNVTRQIVALTRTTLQRLGQRARILDLDRLTLIREIAQQCGVDFPGMRGGRDSDDDEDDDDDDTIPELPDEIDTDVGELRGGPFNYDRSGPRICRFLLDTAPSNCWDGNREREEDIEEYTNDEIQGQANNPVIALDETALAQQASALGTPVNTILESSEFSAVSPEGLQVPGDETGGSGAGGMVVTVGTVLLAAVLAMKLQ